MNSLLLNLRLMCTWYVYALVAVGKLQHAQSNIVVGNETLAIKSDKESRIIGGVPVPISSFPYQVALFYNGVLACGGVIIDPVTVLTAAHCVIDLLPASFVVFAGTTTLSTTDPTFQSRTLTAVRAHSAYSLTTRENDIALLKLSSPFAFNTAIQAVSLPATRVDPAPGSTAFSTGWGFTASGGAPTDELRGVGLSIVSPGDCRAAYRGAQSSTRIFFDKLANLINGLLSPQASTIITAGMVCVQSPGRGTCRADSGGPLVTTTTPPTLIGLNSFGPKVCEKTEIPGVFTKVSAYRDWITANGGP